MLQAAFSGINSACCRNAEKFAHEYVVRDLTERMAKLCDEQDKTELEQTRGLGGTIIEPVREAEQVQTQNDKKNCYNNNIFNNTNSYSANNAHDMPDAEYDEYLRAIGCENTDGANNHSEGNHDEYASYERYLQELNAEGNHDEYASYERYLQELNAEGNHDEYAEYERYLRELDAEDDRCLDASFGGLGRSLGVAEANHSDFSDFSDEESTTDTDIDGTNHFESGLENSDYEHYLPDLDAAKDGRCHGDGDHSGDLRRSLGIAGADDFSDEESTTDTDIDGTNHFESGLENSDYDRYVRDLAGSGTDTEVDGTNHFDNDLEDSDYNRYIRDLGASSTDTEVDGESSTESDTEAQEETQPLPRDNPADKK